MITKDYSYKWPTLRVDNVRSPNSYHQSNTMSDPSDKEKGASHGVSVQPANYDDEKGLDNADLVDATADETLKRQLRARHASMLAIGGAIGTGLIIGMSCGEVDIQRAS